MAPRNSRKRKASQVQSKSKRPKLRATTPSDIEYSDESGTGDPELQAILVQIEAQEEKETQSKQGAKRVASGSKDRGEVMVLDDNANEDSELQEILAQIKAQEESEKLAKRLQGEENRLASKSADKKGKRRGDASPPDQCLEPFRDIFIVSRACTKCRKQVKSPRGYVVFSESTIPPSLALLLHAPCTSCRTNHCRGCFSPVTCPISCKGSRKNSTCKVLDCCAEGRAIAIFEALGGFDRQYIVEQSAAKSRAAAFAKSAQKLCSVGPGGTGYGMSSYGIQPNDKAHKLKASQPASSTWEDTILQSLKTLIDLLPAPYCDNPKSFDLLPHPSIGHLISLSQLPIVLASLLRNDSVTDWISRKDIYNAMLSLLRRMADSELTIRCLIDQRCEALTSCGIQEWMWQTGGIVWNQGPSSELEISPPLYIYFKKLTEQSESFLAGATIMLGEEQEGVDEETIIQGASLCGDIIAARDDLERVINILGDPSLNAPTLPETQPKRSSSRINNSRQCKSRASGINLENVYAEACERLAFKYVPLADDGSYSKYSFKQNLETTQTSTRLATNRFHLLKELAVMSTSLPPGIWVRVDEVRNDAIKVMIAGPDGTPYAGGLFEFDCFLPLVYPNQSPLMHLRTTGGGTVRFNPNLYNCGKVCLSLLGTWSGNPEEQWNPGKSTVLQVLISIQSMILNDVPYFNEPGYGQANPANPASISYNKDIWAKTLQWAILDWLKDENSQGIWRDVIASHFKINKAKIRARILETQSPSLQRFDDGMEIIESWPEAADGP